MFILNMWRNKALFQEIEVCFLTAIINRNIYMFSGRIVFKTLPWTKQLSVTAHWKNPHPLQNKLWLYILDQVILVSKTLTVLFYIAMIVKIMKWVHVDFSTALFQCHSLSFNPQEQEVLTKRMNVLMDENLLWKKITT